MFQLFVNKSKWCPKQHWATDFHCIDKKKVIFDLFCVRRIKKITVLEQHKG